MSCIRALSSIKVFTLFLIRTASEKNAVLCSSRRVRIVNWYSERKPCKSFRNDFFCFIGFSHHYLDVLYTKKASLVYTTGIPTQAEWDYRAKRHSTAEGEQLNWRDQSSYPFPSYSNTHTLWLYRCIASRRGAGQIWTYGCLRSSERAIVEVAFMYSNSKSRAFNQVELYCEVNVIRQPILRHLA